MPQLEFMHICNDAFMTEGTRALNVIGIFDSIHANQFPIFLPKFSVVVQIHTLEGAHKLRMVLKMNDAIMADVNAQFVGTNHQWVNHFAAMQFKEAGDCLIEFTVDEELVGTKRLHIVKES